MTGRPVRVLAHAISQAQRRQHFREGLTSEQIRLVIAEEVKAGRAAGKWMPAVPKWARLFGLKDGHKVRAGQICVWDEAERLCWIVAREETEDVVVTSLNRTVAKAAA